METVVETMAQPGIGLALCRRVRFVAFLFGLILGVAGALAYVMFAVPGPSAVAPVPLPSDPQITVVLGERFLTDVARRAAVDLPGVTVAPDLRVELRDDLIVVHGNVDLLGRRTEGTIVLRPTLRADRLRFEVVETNLGALPLPATEQVVEKTINARIRSVLASIPVTITGVSVDRTRGLTVTCRVNVENFPAEQIVREAPALAPGT